MVCQDEAKTIMMEKKTRPMNIIDVLFSLGGKLRFIAHNQCLSEQILKRV